MPTIKTRNPQTAANSLRAKFKNSTDILTEILGTVLAAAIFAGIVLTSALGMAGAFDHQEAIVVAEVIDAN